MRQNVPRGGVKRPFYAFVDGPRNEADAPLCAEARTLLENFRKYMCPQLEITARERNLGCEKSIPTGIKKVLDTEGRVIVIEDDVLVSRHFLTYMDEALEFYENDKRIWCVNAWRHPFVKVPSGCKDVYFDNRNMCWGWGTWKDRFDAVDFKLVDWPEFASEKKNLKAVDAAGLGLRGMIECQHEGRLGTWDVQCSYHMVKNGLWAVEPRMRMTRNIGMGSGVHCSGADDFMSKLKYWNFKPRLERGIQPDERIVKQFRLAHFNPAFPARAYRKLLRIAMRFAPRNDEPLEVTGR